MSESKPHILLCATPVYGHVMPIRAVAKQIIARGYNATFLTGSEYQESIECIGAKFVALKGDADFTKDKIAEMVKEFLEAVPAPTSDVIVTKGFVNMVPSQHEGVQRAMKLILDGNPDARIVVVFEGSFRGTLPTKLGAMGIQPLGHIGLGVVPASLTSIDTRPCGPGLEYDPSPEGRATNMAAHKKDQHERYSGSQKRWEEILSSLGANVPDMAWRDASYRLADRFIQMCSPSLEYPRSDAPSTFHFSGGLPRGLRDQMTTKPRWWNDIVHKGEKKVVFVSQGTLALNPNDLMIPTMAAFKARDDVIVVCALGKSGTTLPEGTAIPWNARVEDFIPYDDVLEHADVFITNGGYGSLQHSLSNGVPLIVGGEGADKPENAMRVEFSGAGINLNTAHPSEEALYEAVRIIFHEPKYKIRAMEIKQEMESFDPIEVIINNIKEVAEGKET
ncbi:putative UDP-glucuronosyltransferase 2A3 [Rhexocercosporidium sp. MPI-PUGE-AT-0058]|nr:putative UDP-glucuronosyltransferase 2A3 [Rhexocercosporidium sp. MPI-PUGE-AT-0058]